MSVLKPTAGGSILVTVDGMNREAVYAGDVKVFQVLPDGTRYELSFQVDTNAPKA